MNHQEMIDVIKHHASGGEVEFSLRGLDNYSPCPNPRWNFAGWKYRIKRTPREFYINIYEEPRSYLAHATKQGADSVASGMPLRRVKCMKVREVMED